MSDLAPSIAPYIGNDFYDSFVMGARHPELAKSVAPALRAAAERLETERPLEPEVLRIFSLGSTLGQNQGASPLLRVLSRHVKLYGVARAVRWHLARPPRSAYLSRDFPRAAASLTPAQRGNRLARPPSSATPSLRPCGSAARDAAR